MPQSLGHWNRLIGELPMVKSMVESLIFCGVTYHLWWGKNGVPSGKLT